MRQDLERHADSTAQIRSLMQDAWTRTNALAARGDLIQSGGRTLRLICPDVRLRQRLFPALSLGEVTRDPDLEVLALSASAGTPPPWNLPHTHERHLERLHLSASDGFAAHYDVDRKFWIIWDQQASRGLFWIDDPGDVPPWDEAAPLRQLLNWSYAHTDSVMLHGGAVGDTNAALLVGPSGSGKSTTVAACALIGMRVYGDDLVVAERRTDGYKVHTLYDALKLDPYGPLRSKIDFGTLRGREYSGKRHMRLSEVAPEGLAPSANLVAIVRPVVANRIVSAIVPESKSSMLMAVGPPTAFLLRGFEQLALAKISTLVRSLPAFRLELSGDPVEAAQMLKNWLKDRQCTHP